MSDVIWVYCQDEGHRRQGEDGPVRRFEVHAYVLMDGGQWEAVRPNYSARQRRIAKGEEPRPPGPRLLGGDRTPRQLVGGRRDVRARQGMRCAVCRRTVPMNDDTLQRCMTLVPAAGEQEVSLAALDFDERANTQAPSDAVSPGATVRA